MQDACSFVDRDNKEDARYPSSISEADNGFRTEENTYHRGARERTEFVPEIMAANLDHPDNVATLPWLPLTSRR
jgi:hypothetical protein